MVCGEPVIHISTNSLAGKVPKNILVALPTFVNAVKNSAGTQNKYLIPSIGSKIRRLEQTD